MCANRGVFWYTVNGPFHAMVTYDFLKQGHTCDATRYSQAQVEVHPYMPLTSPLLPNFDYLYDAANVTGRIELASQCLSAVHP